VNYVAIEGKKNHFQNISIKINVFKIVHSFLFLIEKLVTCLNVEYHSVRYESEQPSFCVEANLVSSKPCHGRKPNH
jgi:hypothetical protein